MISKVMVSYGELWRVMANNITVNAMVIANMVVNNKKILEVL